MMNNNKYFIHESSYLDEKVGIGDGTKIWHFSHIQSGVVVGKKCSIGQNVNIANNVKIGNHVKIQNNVSVYEGVELETIILKPNMILVNIEKCFVILGSPPNGSYSIVDGNSAPEMILNALELMRFEC